MVREKERVCAGAGVKERERRERDVKIHGTEDELRPGKKEKYRR